jgi:hypothetical protein
MKKPLLFLMVLLAASVCFSQGVTNTSKDERIKGNSSTVAPSFSLSDAEKLVADIMKQIGLKSDFRIRSAKVPNVQADIRRGKRFIEFNPDYVNNLLRTTKDEWVLVFIMAHEIGHHLNGHTVIRGKRSSLIELEADKFAGFVLFKMGASLEQSKLALSYIAKPSASSTHPGRGARLLSLAEGWKEAQAE